MNISKIILDKKADSYRITFNCLDVFDEILAAQKNSDFNLETIYEEFHDLAKTAIKAEPNKVLIRRVTNNLLNHCKRVLSSDRTPVEILESVREKIQAARREIEQTAQKIAIMASRAIAHTNRVLTMSNDYLVIKTILEAEKQKRRFEVFVVKSDPPAEGLDLAEFLAKKGVKTTVIADSQIGVFLPKMNLVFLGADRLYEKGFVHRAGSLPLCLTAKFYNIPVYLLSETRSILLEKERSVKYYDQDSSEVYVPKNSAIQVMNIYYESTPLDLVYKVVCEDGIFEMKEFISWYLME